MFTTTLPSLAVIRQGLFGYLESILKYFFLKNYSHFFLIKYSVQRDWSLSFSASDKHLFEGSNTYTICLGFILFTKAMSGQVSMIATYLSVILCFENQFLFMC